MRYRVFLVACLAIFVGCSAPEPIAVLGAASLDGRPANLIFDSSGEALREALLFARSDWPAAESGYRFGDITYYSTITYDYQSGFDRYGGIHHGAESVQTGVWVR